MYTIATRKKNELSYAAIEDELDINYLHVRFEHVEEGIIRTAMKLEWGTILLLSMRSDQVNKNGHYGIKK